MAKREDFSPGLNSSNPSDSSFPDTSGLEAIEGGPSDASAAPNIQLAQANTGNQVFDLANAPVIATFTSTQPGTRVELPPGTAINLVFYSGPNLYLIQPGGGVIVIEDGKTNWPTLVVDGVEIPFAQLQALFEGTIEVEEGVPTAGLGTDGVLFSSGADLAVPHGGIGDPRGITPILPLTELAFELFPVEDFNADEEEEEEEEVVVVNVVNNELTILSAENAKVDEDGLPGANPDASRPGEVDGGGMTMDTGLIVVDFITVGDIPADLDASIKLLDTPGLDGQLTALNGSPITFALVGVKLVGTAAGVGDIITIEIVTPVAPAVGTEVTYEYKVTLHQAIQHPDPTKEDSDFLNGVQFEVTDAIGGDMATGSFNVEVVDDIPTITSTEAMVTHDESPGLQTAPVSATATEDDDDDDIVVGSLPTELATRLGVLGLSGQLGQAQSSSALV